MYRKETLNQEQISSMLDSTSDDKKTIAEEVESKKKEALQRRNGELYGNLMMKLKDAENNVKASLSGSKVKAKDVKIGVLDPFTNREDRSVARVDSIMARKQPSALLSKDPSPSSMARWILADTKLPALRLEMKRRGRRTDLAKKKIVTDLLPDLMEVIEKDRQEGYL